MTSSLRLRQIVCDASSELALFVYEPKRCVIWNVRDLVKVCDLAQSVTISTRVALSAASAMMTLADWDGGVVTAHQIRTGVQVWKAERIAQPWKLMCCANARLVITTAQYKCIMLDAATGKVVEAITGIGDAYSDSRHDLVLVATRALQLRRTLNGREICRIEHSGTVPSSAWIDDDFIITSKARSVVQLFERHDGTERWRYDPGEGRHVNLVAVPPGSDRCFGVRIDTEKGGWGCVVVALRLNDGTVEHELELAKGGAQVACMGRAMVFVNGVLWLPELEWVPFDFLA